VTPANVLPLHSAEKSNPSPKQKTASNPDASAVLTKDSKPVPVDTVSISQQSHQAIINIEKEEPKKVEAQKQDVNQVAHNKEPNSTIQYVYDLKGNLIINYMDSNNRLIYQVPTELNLFLKEAVAKAASSVDTKV
jgi:hypothetical protein